MSQVPPLRPSGVGAYTGVKQPKTPPENYESPIPDDEPTPPRMSRRDLVIFALIVSVLVTVSTILLLTLVVPWNYPQHVSVSLDQGNGWDVHVCIPTAALYSGPGSILVSFAWTTSNRSSVDLVMVPHGYILQDAAYNVTASSGSGSYQATANLEYENNVYLQFIAFGAPALPAFVNVSIAYTVPGHVLGGSSAPGTC